MISPKPPPPPPPAPPALASSPASEPAAASKPAPQQEQPAVFGVTPGTTKGERRKLNARARAILQEKPQDADLTADDLAALARYTGTGGVGDSLNEFYTPEAVAAAMWQILRAAGFSGGAVLEPCSGTGVFLRTAPTDARVTAAELSPISGRICRALNPRHEVRIGPFERFATTDGRLYDAVIGNPPFGVRGALVKDDKPDIGAAEQYFLDTMLDKTADGGLCAVVVPSTVADARNGRAFRERLQRKAAFVGGFRMPTTAFEAAHTTVTTDVLLFRKRPADVAGALSTVDSDMLDQLGAADPEWTEGRYFTGSGAGHVLGVVGTDKRAFGEIYAVHGSMVGVPDAIAAWQPPAERLAAATAVTVPDILEAIGDDPAARRRATAAALKPAYQVAQVGDVKVIDGVRYVLTGEPPRWHRADGETPPVVEDALRVAQLLDDLAEGRPRDQERARADLIERLDAFVREHGIPARSRDLRAWIAAPALPPAAGTDPSDHARQVDQTRRRVAALLGAVGDDGVYSDLVTGRVRETERLGLDTAAEKLALESGGFTPEELAAATGRSRDAVLDHLLASPVYTVDADGRTWTTRDLYLSGELWPKLDAARAALAHGGIEQAYRHAYERQVRALEEAIAPQSLDDVEIQFGSGFLTPEDLTAWFAARADAWRERNPRASWSGPPAATLTYQGGAYIMAGAGHDRDLDLIERSLNRRGVKKDERERLERITREFRSWLLSSDRREAVEDRYNRQYRGFRPRAYSDEPMAIPGLAADRQPNRYQWPIVRWALEAGKGILAADVGLGKTVQALLLTRMAKASGSAKRPVIVVPKSVAANWQREAEMWFPGARCLVIGETYSTNKAGELVAKADDEAARRRKLHDLRQNDYDFVFVTLPAWNAIDIDPDIKESYQSDDFWVQRSKALEGATSKRVAKLREQNEQAKAKREFRNREDTLTFDQLGIDMLVMDEGHSMKNLYGAKNRFGMSPKFLGAGDEEGSKRAHDTRLKARFVREQNDGKGVYFLTATPTKNSPLEIFNMLSHIAPEAFERLGIKNAEDFIDRFVEFADDRIIGTSGQLEDALVTSGFKNLDELREVMKRFIDRKTAADVGLVIPARDDRLHTVDMTAEQERVYQGLRAEAEASKNGDANAAHIFSIMDRMGKATIDLELLGPAYAGEPSPKMDAAADQIAAGIKDGGQVVFCEALPAHEKLIAALERRGIPRDQVGLVNAQAAPSGADRQRIADGFNAGRLKVVIGNKTMEEGMNLQRGATDIHHLDLPWEPASLQQRNGRAVRQGNKKASVRVHTYLAKGSFDGYRWQTVAAKKDWQDLLWNGGDKVENLMRFGMSQEDMQVMFAADPEAARKKIAEDKAAALAKLTAEGKGRAADLFARLQQMQRSLAGLRAKASEKGKEATGPAVARLEYRIGRLRDDLRDSKFFAHKALLASEAPAIVTQTGRAFAADTAFELAPGPESPIRWSDQPTKWVVTSVDPETGEVSARQYGTLTPQTITTTAASLEKGSTPFSFSAEAEASELRAQQVAADKLAAEAKTQRDREVAERQRGTWEGVKALPPATLAEMAPQVQAMMKDAVRGYRDGGSSAPYGLIRPDGTPTIVPGYDARKAIDTHDLMLPLPEHRQKAIEAYVAMQEGRTYKTRHSERNRRGYGGDRVVGMKPVYGGFEFDTTSAGDNPWRQAMARLWGPDVEGEAVREVRRRAVDRISAAPDFRTAMLAAAPTVQITSWQPSYTQPGDWPEATVRALRQAAERLGVLDQQMGVAATPDSSYRSAWHPLLMSVRRLAAGRDEGLAAQSSTVREWLEALLPSEGEEARAA